MAEKRPNLDEYFMTIAEVAKTRSTCLSRKVGAVIVKDKRVLATGYNGAPSGCMHCTDIGYCIRKKKGFSSGAGLELCRAGHAESNAIDQAAKFGIPIEGATLYVTLQPCVFCAIRIINSGIKEVVFKGEYPTGLALELLKEAGVVVRLYEEQNGGGKNAEKYMG